MAQKESEKIGGAFSRGKLNVFKISTNLNTNFMYVCFQIDDEKTISSLVKILHLAGIAVFKYFNSCSLIFILPATFLTQNKGFEWFSQPPNLNIIGSEEI